jgi:hypothetical protein
MHPDMDPVFALCDACNKNSCRQGRAEGLLQAAIRRRILFLPPERA